MELHTKNAGKDLPVMTSHIVTSITKNEITMKHQTQIEERGRGPTMRPAQKMPRAVVRAKTRKRDPPTYLGERV